MHRILTACVFHRCHATRRFYARGGTPPTVAKLSVPDAACGHETISSLSSRGYSHSPRYPIGKRR
jgi:hypothetical protein